MAENGVFRRPNANLWFGKSEKPLCLTFALRSILKILETEILRRRIIQDLLFEREFSDEAAKIHYFHEVGSTMDIARELARKGCPDFTVLVAGSQKQGRGRLNRVWLSSEGGLWFSIVIRPKIPPEMSCRINFCASLTLVKTLRRMFGIDAMVKWPNDILVDEKKITGMLSEMEADGDKVPFVNIGIGINVNNDPSVEEPKASSLKKILGREVSGKELLAEFLDDFEARMNSGDFENVISQWKEYSITLNRQVKIVTTHETSEGTAVNVDEDGALILRLDDGSLRRVIYGDCFL